MGSRCEEVDCSTCHSRTYVHSYCGGLHGYRVDDGDGLPACEQDGESPFSLTCFYVDFYQGMGECGFPDHEEYTEETISFLSPPTRSSR
jgi:hypothetical protein